MDPPAATPVGPDLWWIKQVWNLCPLTRDISTVIQSNPDLLGAITVNAPQRFQDLITNALAADYGREAAQRIAPTLISTSIGINHQVDTREDYRAHLNVAITLLVGS